MKPWKLLDEMIRSSEYEMFQSDKLGSDLFISDPDRATRIHEYSESGSEGSTYAEIIEDWRDFLDTLKEFDPEYDDQEEYESFDIDQTVANNIRKEIDECETWHEKNGSLHKIIG